MLAVALSDGGRGRVSGSALRGRHSSILPAPLADGSVLLISTARLVWLDGTELLGEV